MSNSKGSETMSALDDKITQFTNDVDLAHEFIHNDASTPVQTAGGPVPSIAAIASEATTSLTGTSTSSVTLATGNLSFAVAGKQFAVGQLLIAASGANYAIGQVASYDGTTLVINATTVVGTGTFTSWTIALTGATGAPGTAGAAGAAVLNGTGAPAAGTGNNGDFYIDTTAHAVYGPKTAGAWGSATSLVGPTGAAGNTVLSGSGTPAAGTGVDGNFYIDTTAYALYGPKASGSWPTGVSLVGTPGTAGADGNTVLYGAGAPVAGTGVNGNFYIDTTANFIYGPKAVGSWPTGTSIVGPTGAAGNTILSGTGAPAAGTGANGNFYIDTAASTLYGPKAAGSWPTGVSLIGPQGGSGTRFDYGTITTAGTVTLNYAQGQQSRVQVGVAITIAFSNWPASGVLGERLLELVNGAAFAVTWPAIRWVLSDGTYTTTFASNGVTLQSSGTDWILLWSTDGGTTVYGKVMR